MLNYCHTVVACVDLCLSALLNQLGENNVSSSTQDNKHLFSVSLRIAMHHLLARTPPRQEAACRARIECRSAWHHCRHTPPWYCPSSPRLQGLNELFGKWRNKRTLFVVLLGQCVSLSLFLILLLEETKFKWNFFFVSWIFCRCYSMLCWRPKRQKRGDLPETFRCGTCRRRWGQHYLKEAASVKKEAVLLNTLCWVKCREVSPVATRKRRQRIGVCHSHDRKERWWSKFAHWR